MNYAYRAAALGEARDKYIYKYYKRDYKSDDYFKLAKNKDKFKA
jgi:hypothetical protein